MGPRIVLWVPAGAVVVELLQCSLAAGWPHAPAAGTAAGTTGPQPALDRALAACRAAHGSSGRAFVECVDREVWPQGRKLHEYVDGRSYTELIRNYSCAQDDGSTAAVRTTEVTIAAGYNPCEDAEAASAGPQPRALGFGRDLHPDFVYIPGVLPAGHDIGKDRQMTAREAADLCLAVEDCAGFTLKSENRTGRGQVFFKSTTAGQRPEAGWHTYRLARPLTATCPAALGSAVSGETRTFTVEIIRESPLIAVVKRFATPEECQALVEAGGNWETMSRAYTSQGGINPYRRSYSANIYPPLQEPANAITQLVSRMFGVTRNLTGYAVFPPGQEPVNGVLYKNIGDEYRPHCDGRCRNESYIVGERVATSILYCWAPQEGGQTSFTADALKVAPDMGDMLLFAYLQPGGRMSGPEAQHSGCPLRRGRKWIGTQWYREGVSEDFNWEAARAGVQE